MNKMREINARLLINYIVKFHQYNNLTCEENGNIVNIKISNEVISIDLKNNTVKLFTKTAEMDIPDIISIAMENNAGVNNLELVNCSISNNKIKMNDGAKVAQIRVKSGNASDTVVKIENTEVTSKPQLEVKYNKVTDSASGKELMQAKITSNKQIPESYLDTYRGLKPTIEGTNKNILSIYSF